GLQSFTTVLRNCDPMSVSARPALQVPSLAECHDGHTELRGNLLKRLALKVKRFSGLPVVLGQRHGREVSQAGPTVKTGLDRQDRSGPGVGELVVVVMGKDGEREKA